MERKEAYNEIVSSFKRKYGFLGEQFAEEFLLAVAGYNLQEYSNTEFRVRRHPLLYWAHGWLKSGLLMRAYEILGDDLCMMMSDITPAALRGTVEGGTFLVPFALKTPFAICTEFGQIISGSDSGEMIQKLLNLLEEGVVTVSLAKIARVSMEDIDNIEGKYNIKFKDNNTFTYKSNWVLFAATYNRKFLVDNAFESRFSVIAPKQRLGVNLIKHINESAPFTVSLEAIEVLRSSVKETTAVDWTVKMPDEAYQYLSNMRDSGSVLTKLMCLKWWGLKPTSDDAVFLAKELATQRDAIWMNTEDKMLDMLSKGDVSMSEFTEEIGVTSRTIQYAIIKLSLRNNKYKDEEGVMRWHL